jgi:hypothetical protein
MCRRRQRRPGAPCALPRAWRRQRRLAFWWQLAILAQDQPRLLACAAAAGPLWLLLRLMARIGSIDLH